jgi:putative ABC transport system permease protein
MKYFPLLWAALMRKKLRLLLTVMSAIMAFTLFGMMAGFKASLDRETGLARADRIFIMPRFGFEELPETLKQKLAAIPGVAKVTAQNTVEGYYRDPHNPAVAMAVDPDVREVWPEISVSAAQLATLSQDQTAVFLTRGYARRFDKKVGDIFPIKAPEKQREDGGQTWAFHVIGIIDDMDTEPGGFALTSLKGVNQAKAESDRYKGGIFRVLATDPRQGEALAKRIDRDLANSATPTRSFTERSAYQNAFAGSGIDIGFIIESIAGAGLFMILFLVGNSIAQSVHERRVEFAVLKTIGFSDAGIILLVAAEAMTPCLMGAALGTGVATGFATIFPRLIPPAVGVPAPAVGPAVAVTALAAAALVAALAAAIPAGRIARTDIATALSGR